VSIVRVGLAETKKFAEGYDAIFSKKAVKKSETKKTKSAKSGAKRKSAAKRKK
jgi:hypothetical protein